MTDPSKRPKSEHHTPTSEGTSTGTTQGTPKGPSEVSDSTKNPSHKPRRESLAGQEPSQPNKRDPSKPSIDQKVPSLNSSYNNPESEPESTIGSDDGFNENARTRRVRENGPVAGYLRICPAEDLS